MHTITNTTHSHKAIVLLLLSILLICTTVSRSLASQQPASIPHATSAIPEARLEALGAIPGPARILASQSGLTLAGGMNRLNILNTVDIDNPRIIASMKLPGMIHGAVLRGRYAYIGYGECGSMFSGDCTGGLQIIDLSDPTLPYLVGSFTTPHTVFGPVIFGSYALLADTGYTINTPLSVVHIIDISIPARPTKIGTIPESATDYMALAHHPGDQRLYVFLNCYGSGMKIYDLTVPSAPILVNTVAIGEWPLGFSLYEEPASNSLYAYTTDYAESNPGIHVFDFSDITHPVERSFIPLRAQALNVIGHVLLAETSSQIYIYDISQLTTPVLKSIVDTTGNGQLLALDAQHALISTATNVMMIDLSDPAIPVLTDWLRTIGVPFTGVPASVALDDHLLYLPVENRIELLDILNPAEPRFAGTLAGSHVTVSGDYAITVGDIDDPVLRINDMSESAPVQLGVLNVPFQFRRVVGLSTSGLPGTSSAYAYLAWAQPDIVPLVTGKGGLYIFDISNLSAPSQRLHLPIAEDVRSMTVSFPYIYLATAKGLSESRVQVIDVTQPENPTVVGSLALPSYVRDLAFANNRIYAATDQHGTQIIDVSQPTTPSIIGAFVPPDASSTQAVMTENGIVYALSWVSYGASTLYIIDASDSAAPVVLERYPVQLTGDGMVVHNGLIALLNGLDGISLLRHGATAGTVVDTLGLPVAGTRVTTQGAPTASGFTGAYAINDAVVTTAADSTHITAELNGYTSWPPTRSLTEAAAGIANFTMLAPPVSIPITPAEGGTAHFTDTSGATTVVTVAPGTIAAPAILHITPTIGPELAPWAFAGHTFELSLDQDTNSEQFATVTINYREAEIRLVSDESQLTLRRWDGEAWQDAATDCAPVSVYSRDAENNTLQITICETGRYALFGPTNRSFLPFVAQ